MVIVERARELIVPQLAKSDTQPTSRPAARVCGSGGMKDYVRPIEGEPRVHERWGDLASKETALVTLEAISSLLDQRLGLLHERIANVEGNLGTLTNRVDDIVPRRDFGSEAIRQWVHVIRRRYNDECPCCRKEKVLDDEGNRLKTSHLDHFRGREHNRETDGWLVCQMCNNINLKNSEFKNAALKRFQVFQEDRRDLHAGHPAKPQIAETQGRLFEL
jgi:hypothetical protein